MVDLTEEERIFLCLLCHKYIRQQLDSPSSKFYSVLSFDEVMEIVRKLSEEGKFGKKSQT